MKTYEEKAYSALKRIEEENQRRRKKKRAVTRTAAPVVGLCIAVLSGIGVWQYGIFNQPDIYNSDNDTTNKNENSADSVHTDISAKTEYKLYTPSVKLPENISDNTMNSCMIGCLVYKGKVYTSSDSYNADAAEFKHLVGEYVGEAKGNLDEWSVQDEWSKEFASTYSGPVYKVNGYDEEFRLCIYLDTEDGVWLQLLDNYDGIGLNTGADLFENRLHLKENLENIRYLTHNDWNDGSNAEYKELSGVSDERLENFFNSLCESPFEKIDYVNDSDFYDADKQGHIYLNMKDKTVIELRLIDGGYVGLQELGWYFVKMPAEIFEPVFSACQ